MILVNKKNATWFREIFQSYSVVLTYLAVIAQPNYAEDCLKHKNKLPNRNVTRWSDSSRVKDINDILKDIK